MQQAFICGCIKENPVATRIVKRNLEDCTESEIIATGRKPRRKHLSRVYSPTTGSGTVRVCKGLFLSTLKVSNDRLDRALAAQRANGEVPQKDKRGCNAKRKIAQEHVKEVMDHINMFLRYISHYTRNHQEHRQFLAQNLSIRILYEDYKQHCQQVGRPCVKESFYRKVFVTKFNLHFHQPLKDTCQKCDRFDITLKATPSDSAVAAQKELHQRKAEKSRETLKNSKALTSLQHAVFTFDLQKTLICPVVTTGVAYYKRQLCVYNLGIHDIVDDSAKMYVWDESVASRGATEIGSCLFRYIQQKVTSGAHTITMFSDSCGGQNRNFKIASLMSYLAEEMKVVITLHFMQSGHSFLPNDADFGVIEKEKKLHVIFTYQITGERSLQRQENAIRLQWLICDVVSLLI